MVLTHIIATGLDSVHFPTILRYLQDIQNLGLSTRHLTRCYIVQNSALSMQAVSSDGRPDFNSACVCVRACAHMGMLSLSLQQPCEANDQLPKGAPVGWDSPREPPAGGAPSESAPRTSVTASNRDGGPDKRSEEDAQGLMRIVLMRRTPSRARSGRT